MKGVVLLGGVFLGLTLSAWAEECTLVSQEKAAAGSVLTDPRDLPARQCVGVEDPETLKNPVDRLVCADPALSNLAERLNRAYDRALSATNDPAPIVAAQRRWQEELKRCLANPDAEAGLYCVWRRYEVRLFELTRNDPLPDCVLHEKEIEKKRLLGYPSLKEVLALQPCPEAEFMPDETYKIGCLKKWFGNPKDFSLRWAKDSPVPKTSRACRVLFQALANSSPEIEYIEPIVRTSEVMHPALARYRACEDTFGGTGYDESDYYVLQTYLGHGFRLYRVNLGGNPKSALREYIYAEEEKHDTKFPSGYTRLGFPAGGTPKTPDECQAYDMITTASQRRERLLYADFGVNALIRFRGSYYIYDAVTSVWGTKDLNLHRYDPKKQSFLPIPPYCRWMTFQK
ncbi:MAG: hypothetical protein FWD77_12095 [Betaproteobacteria bacterium]|nr:hypothetical protein [Betaproteobacteria bacterium]